MPATNKRHLQARHGPRVSQWLSTGPKMFPFPATLEATSLAKRHLQSASRHPLPLPLPNREVWSRRREYRVPPTQPPPPASLPTAPQPPAQVPPTLLTWPLSSPGRASSLQQQMAQLQKGKIPRQGYKYIDSTQHRENRANKGSRGCREPRDQAEPARPSRVLEGGPGPPQAHGVSPERRLQPQQYFYVSICSDA